MVTYFPCVAEACMPVSWIGWEAVNESVLLTPVPLGCGLKLGTLPSGHCMMVVFWTRVENTQFYTVCVLCPECPVIGYSANSVHFIENISDRC